MYCFIYIYTILLLYIINPCNAQLSRAPSFTPSTAASTPSNSAPLPSSTESPQLSSFEQLRAAVKLAQQQSTQTAPPAPITNAPVADEIPHIVDVDISESAAATPATISSDTLIDEYNEMNIDSYTTESVITDPQQYVSPITEDDVNSDNNGNNNIHVNNFQTYGEIHNSYHSISDSTDGAQQTVNDDMVYADSTHESVVPPLNDMIGIQPNESKNTYNENMYNNVLIGETNDEMPESTISTNHFKPTGNDIDQISVESSNVPVCDEVTGVNVHYEQSIDRSIQSDDTINSNTESIHRVNAASDSTDGRADQVLQHNNNIELKTDNNKQYIDDTDTDVPSHLHTDIQHDVPRHGMVHTITDAIRHAVANQSTSFDLTAGTNLLKHTIKQSFHTLRHNIATLIADAANSDIQ